MKVKRPFFIILTIILITSINSNLMAASTIEIDRVRDKVVLNDRDLKVIDDFLADSIGAILRTRDFTSVAKLRSVILSKQTSNQDTQNQYTKQFSESAYKYISEGLQQALILRPQERQTRVIINLLILIDGLQDLNLVDLALEKLQDDNMAIRYWAVHSVTNIGILNQLNSDDTSNRKLAQKIIEQLQEIIDSSSPEILALIARFAAELNIPQVNELLLKIADLRIERYADWTVKHERLDSLILKLLENKIIATSKSVAGKTTTAVDNQNFARRFAQLYSFAIQRYIKGTNLNDKQKQQLITVLIETEEKCINSLLGQQQFAIRKAIEENDMTALQAEHDRLLGSQENVGLLPAKFGFDYGTEDDGSKRTAPLPLPDQPLK
jgi:hypothetical protein